MTNPHKTEIIIVLDRSGSMDGMQADMEGGLAQFIRHQRQVPGVCLLTLVQFDSEIETVFVARDLREVEPIRLQPRGGTALFDALGTTITDAGTRLARLPAADRPGKVLVLIITDGEENASTTWSARRIRAAIRRQTREYAWEFVYLGANVNAFAEARDLGLKSCSALSFTSTSARQAGDVLGQKVEQFRATGERASLKFDEADRRVSNEQWHAQLDRQAASELD